MNPSLQIVGWLNGNVAVQADFNLIASSIVVYVTLSQPYTLSTVPGQPIRPQFCGSEVARGEDVPGAVIMAGARVALLSFEAAAIVVAGGGVLS